MWLTWLFMGILTSSLMLKAVDTARSPAFMVGALLACYLPLIGQTVLKWISLNWFDLPLSARLPSSHRSDIFKMNFFKLIDWLIACYLPLIGQTFLEWISLNWFDMDLDTPQMISLLPISLSCCSDNSIISVWHFFILWLISYMFHNQSPFDNQWNGIFAGSTASSGHWWLRFVKICCNYK